MPIRCATRPIDNLTHALAGMGLGLLGLLFLAPVASAQPDIALQMNLDQARQLAVHSLKTGNPGLAIKVSRGLLQADRRDPMAYYILATAHSQLKQPRPGRKAAARAYRFADTGPARFQAAQLAARMAYAENRPTLAQIWLRRTAIHAPTKQEEQQVARDYRTLRARNPWSFRLRTDLRPSSNINNGADTALQIIDGVPVTGFLSGSAQALSGVIGSFDVATTYRLRANTTSATTLGGRLYMQRVSLSSSARAKAPTTQNSDFASTFAELSLRHSFAVGARDQGATAAIGLAIGESWFAGARTYRFGRLSGERSWRLGQGNTRLKLHGSAERRTMARYGTNNARILSLGADLSRGLKNGDRLSFSLALRDTDAGWADTTARRANGTFRSASLRTSYGFGKPIGPARLSAGVVLGYSDYDAYRSGIIWVPGGRQDKSVYGDLSLLFDDLDYAGFAPVLRIRGGRKFSNDSRFNTREFSVSLSIVSKF